MPFTITLLNIFLVSLLTGFSPLLHAESKCQTVAAALNDRFRHEGECADKPFYTCAGIVLHVLENNAFMMMQADDYQSSDTSCDKQSQVPWCPNSASIMRDVVSFSFLHKDITANYGYPIFSNAIGTAGFIFKSSAIQDYLLCAYPVDAMSFSRKNCACGEWGEPLCNDVNSVRATCEQNGIYTDADFFNKYIANNNSWDIKAMCSFGKEATSFDAFISSSQMIVSNSDKQANWNPYCSKDKLEKCAGWNELVLKPWFDIPYKDIPIEAFFYVTDSHNLYPNSSDAKTIANKMAEKFPGGVPVLGINIDNIYDESSSGPFFCNP